MPVPPYSSATVMPSRPSSPNLRHSSAGNVVAVDRGARGDLFVGEGAHGVAQQVDLAEIEIEAFHDAALSRR